MKFPSTRSSVALALLTSSALVGTAFASSSDAAAAAAAAGGEESDVLSLTKSSFPGSVNGEVS